MANRAVRGKRKRAAAGLWAAAAVALGVALWLLLVNAVFVVRDVRVVGAGEVPEDDVRRLCGIRLGQRMNALDEECVRLDVQSDGRLAFVSLEKRLPSRVVLTVRPRTMDAMVLQGGRILVLDSDAYVVRVTDRIPDGNIPYVSGLKTAYYTLGRQLEAGDAHCAAMKAVTEALTAQNARAYVAELSVANPEDLRIITRTGMTVRLGDAGNMDNKIAWMAGALADLEARGEIQGQLDVSSGTKADYTPPAPETADADGQIPQPTVPADGEAAPLPPAS